MGKLYNKVGIDFAPPPGGGARILLADDEPLLREAIQNLLKQLGFQVEIAKDGAEALGIFRNHPDGFDLVILDINMPRLDGRQTLQAIRAIHPGLPVILSSGNHPMDLANLLQPNGATAFLPKPYSIDDLQRMLGEILG
jgi:CheY-like chemotaxis protein